MRWFSKKHPRTADDALVEQTLAVAQEVAQETSEDDQALLAVIDGIRLTPAKPAPRVNAIDEFAQAKPTVSALLPTVSFSGIIEEPAQAPLPVTIKTPPAPPLPQPVLRVAASVNIVAAVDKTVAVADRAVAGANAEPVERRLPLAPPSMQSDMRREIAQRVQQFQAHQQRLIDEREARIKKVYAEMQSQIEISRIRKSPPIS